MKIVNGLIFSILIASATSASAAPLDEKSKMLDWGHATPDEKNVWIANFKFKQPDINRAEVAECLEKRVLQPVFESNDLLDVTQMCGTIAALPK